MTKIWIQCDPELACTDADQLNMESLMFMLNIRSCGSLAGMFPSTRLKLRSKASPTDYFDVGGMMYVSSRLKNVLEGFQAEAEFFPVGIAYENKRQTRRRYYLCNILACVDCFDHAKGKYTYWKKPGFTDRVDGIRRLAIDEKKVASRVLFRIAKGGEYLVCVSDALAERIEELGYTGMEFIDPKNWRFGCG